jgi:peptide deformylase
MSTLLNEREKKPLWLALEESSQLEEIQKEFERNRPEIILHPDPRLRHRCTTIEGAESCLIELEMALRDPLGNEYLGVGLSANQIGRTERACIIRFGDYILDLIGPRIVEHSDNRRGSTEGCLSCPELQTTVMRWEEIVIGADNYRQPLIIKNFDVARIVQHEVDHLNSVLLTDYLPISRNDPCPCGSGKKFKKCCREIEIALDKRRR